jgi:hypothetical protein
MEDHRVMQRGKEVRKQRTSLWLGGILFAVAVVGPVLAFYAPGLAQQSQSIEWVPEARRPMGMNLPAYRMDVPGAPIDEQIVGDLETLGAKWVRFEFRAVGDPPAVPIAGYATAIDRLSARGIRVLGLVDYTTVPRPKAAWGTTAYREEFVRTASELAAEFKDEIHYWEIWNEEDIGYKAGSSTGDTYLSPQDYAYLLGGDPTASPSVYPWAAMGVTQAIKNADPGANVLLGGLSNAWKASDGGGAGHYLEALYQQLGALGYAEGGWPFDIVAVHPYCGNETDPSIYLFDSGDYILRNNLWSVMAAHGDGGKRFWITEIGWNTNTTQWVCMPPFVSEENQAAYLETSWQIFLAEPTGEGQVLVDRVFWYQYQDTGARVDPAKCPVATATPVAYLAPESYERVRPPRVTPTPNPDQRQVASVVIDAWWGLVHGDYQPKPAYGVYRDFPLPSGRYVYLPVVLRGR